MNIHKEMLEALRFVAERLDDDHGKVQGVMYSDALAPQRDDVNALEYIKTVIRLVEDEELRRKIPFCYSAYDLQTKNFLHSGRHSSTIFDCANLALEFLLADADDEDRIPDDIKDNPEGIAYLLSRAAGFGIEVRRTQPPKDFEDDGEGVREI